MRLTYAQIKDDVGRAIGVCADDTALLKLVNEASQILWNECDWVGKYVKYLIRVSGDCEGNACIVWPRQLETIEGLGISSRVIGIRDQWFEFQENATGQVNWQRGAEVLADYGEVCTLSEIVGTSSKLKVYADRSEQAGLKLLVLGYDEHQNWIRTQVGGEWVDGEYITITNSAPTVSINYFSKVTGVQKPLTHGPVRLYSMDVDTLIETSLGIFDWDEELPVYRRSILTAQSCANCECVYVMGARRHIKVRDDTDYVYPAHLPALQTALIGIHKRDQGDFGAYGAALGEAKRLLMKQAIHYRGKGVLRPINFVNRGTWAPQRNVL